MTLVLSFVCAGVAVQVADRLVCELRGRALQALNPIANKLVIYRAKDAIVSIGYAGQAYVGTIPTDEWIAQLISGIPFDNAADGMHGVRLGRTQNWDVGKAVRRIAAELPQHIIPGMIVQLTIVGHQINRRGLVRPLLYEIQLTSNGIDEFYQTARNWPPGYGGISAIGVHLGDAELQGILTKIRDANPALTHDQIAEFLTATIRKNVHPGVGANTSAIIIPLPGSAAVRSKFFPIEPHPVLLRTPSEDRSVNVHYSPWLVGPGLIKWPTAEVGGSTYSLGGIEVGVEADGPTAGLLSMMATVPRFELPAHLNTKARLRTEGALTSYF